MQYQQGEKKKKSKQPVSSADNQEIGWLNSLKAAFNFLSSYLQKTAETAELSEVMSLLLVGRLAPWRTPGWWRSSLEAEAAALQCTGAVKHGHFSAPLINTALMALG